MRLQLHYDIVSFDSLLESVFWGNTCQLAKTTLERLPSFAFRNNPARDDTYILGYYSSSKSGKYYLYTLKWNP